MNRGWKILGWIVVALIGLPALAIGALLAVGNLGGAEWIAGRATALTEGRVTLQGVSGTFPTDLRIANLALRDAEGTWLRVDGLTIHWSPLGLLRGVARLGRLDAARIALLRQPTAEKDGRSAGLPLGIYIDALRVDRLEFSAAVAGAPAVLAVDGEVRLDSLDSGRVSLLARRLDAAGGTYEISGKIARDTVALRIAVDEPAQGLVAGLADLPTLGPLKLDATLDGPRTDEHARLALDAGPLRLEGHGTVDLVGKRIDIAVTGSSPAMRPAPDIAWRAAALDARVRGTFTAPEATGRLRIDGPEVGGAKARRVTADIRGDDGTVTAAASFVDVIVPGPKPEILAGAPLTLRAEAALATPTRPITFTLAHPLIQASGRVDTGADVAGTFTLELPALRPFATAASIDLDGDAILSGRFSGAGATTRLSISGAINATGGDPVIVRSIGSGAAIDLAVSERNGLLRIDQLALDGKAIRATASGARSAAGVIDLAWNASLSALSAFVPGVDGTATVRGTLKGPTEDLALAADAAVVAAVAGLPAQPIDIGLRLSGLPRAPAGQLTARGQVAGAPLRIAAKLALAPDGALRIGIETADWKSVRLTGALTLPPGAALPLGRLQLRVARLVDLQAQLDQEVFGSVTARIDTVTARGGIQARFDVRGEQIGIAGARFDRLALDGTVDRLATDRLLALNLTLDGLHAGDLAGRLALAARGPAERPDLHLTALLNPPGKGEARVTAAATAAPARRTLDIGAFEASYRGQTARLVQPVHIDLANGVDIGDIRLRAGAATVAASGRITPTLQLRASVRNVSAQLLSSFVTTGVAAAGAISADAVLDGTLSSPSGTIRVSGRGLRGWSGPGAVSADFDATARLRGDVAAIDATLAAGKAGKLTVRGSLPFGPGAALDLVAAGGLDLGVFDRFLTAEGRRLRGEATLDLTAGGTLAAPHVTGTIRLRDGEVQDYAQGILIAGLTADIQIDDGVARITRFTGRAGEGTVALAGMADLLAPGTPVDITVTARGAKLPARDLVTAVVDADIRLRGRAVERLHLAGTVHVNRADVQLPDALPKSVAVLDVRRPGQQPHPPGPAPALDLDLTIDAPRAIFVRGHGLDAEMGGRIRIGGTAADPSVTGAFALRRGSLDFAGQTLQFTTGTVSFDGRSLTGNLDPTLDFVAEKTSGDVTARIGVTGYADDPKIRLTSTPDLPQDEVLAHLLFARSVSELTPIEIAQIGSAIASIGGGAGFSPLAELRKGLGLDVLSVGGADASGGTAGATVEAGKYVAEGVFLGSKQSLSGGTRAELKVDLTKRLKLETELNARGGGPVTGAGPGNDPGSSIGLTYEFEY